MPVAKSETTPMKSKILNIGISLKKLRYNVDEFGKNTFMTAKAEIFIRVRKKNLISKQKKNFKNLNSINTKKPLQYNSK